MEYQDSVIACFFFYPHDGASVYIYLSSFLSFSSLFFDKWGSLLDRQAFNVFIVKLFEIFGSKFETKFIRNSNDE